MCLVPFNPAIGIRPREFRFRVSRAGAQVNRLRKGIGGSDGGGDSVRRRHRHPARAGATSSGTSSTMVRSWQAGHMRTSNLSSRSSWRRAPVFTARLPFADDLAVESADHTALDHRTLQRHREQIPPGGPVGVPALSRRTRDMLILHSISPDREGQPTLSQCPRPASRGEASSGP